MRRPHPIAARTAAVLALAVAIQGAAGAAVRHVFVTSVAGNGDLGSWPDAGAATGAAAGDAICQARAAAAGLPNAGQYVAWLSTVADEAYCRLHGLAGRKIDQCGQPALPAAAGPWLRTNATAFAEGVPGLLTPDRQVYLPARRDENGAAVTGDIWTATAQDGSRFSFGDCSGWTSSSVSASGWLGTTEGTGSSWTSASGRDCSFTAHLLCFERGVGDPLPRFANWGRLAFVTSTGGTGDLGSWPEAGGQTGLAAGDAICRSLAATAGLPGAESFKAWLSTGAVDARDRFQYDGPWMRLDRVRIAADLAGLTDGVLNSALNRTETGSYRGLDWVWTGTDAAGAAAAERCADWTSAAPGDDGRTGLADRADDSWTRYTAEGCDLTFAALYCLQDLPLVFGDGFESGDGSVWSLAVP